VKNVNFILIIAQISIGEVEVPNTNIQQELAVNNKFKNSLKQCFV
jgi:hypothetical protein